MTKLTEHVINEAAELLFAAAECDEAWERFCFHGGGLKETLAVFERHGCAVTDHAWHRHVRSLRDRGLALARGEA